MTKPDAPPEVFGPCAVTDPKFSCDCSRVHVASAFAAGRLAVIEEARGTGQRIIHDTSDWREFAAALDRLKGEK